MPSEILSLALMAGLPLLLAVLGETVLERSGMINIGLEGMLLTAAMAGVAVAQSTGSALAGLVGGVAGALIIAALFGLMAIEFRADQIVTGAAINFLALGMTGIVYRAFNAGDYFVSDVPRLRPTPETLAALPVVGALFEHDWIVSAGWIVAPTAVGLFLWRSRAGLRLRAAGENPHALAGVGHSVAASQWLALAIEAVLVGTGGAYLSLGLSSGFAENMVAGRGFIALAIVVFGGWRARGAIAGVALFAAASALQYWLQAANRGIPFHLLLAFPYALTLLILAAFAGRLGAPAALGRPRP
jgi:simple sugar transport system permease protein